MEGGTGEGKKHCRLDQGGSNATGYELTVEKGTGKRERGAQTSVQNKGAPGVDGGGRTRPLGALAGGNGRRKIFLESEV
jgi:hypothetical protein